VYFDNLQVSQEHGRISEENHYYAFGQKIAGICTKAFNKLSNSFNYQGDYSEEEENTLWDEFDLRMYDPQIGRWTGADPYDQFASPYIGMGNDPVNSVDPSGGGIDGPGPSFVSLSSIQDTWNNVLVPLGWCKYCGDVAETLSDFVVTASRAATPSVIDYVQGYAQIAKHYLWDSWSGAGSEWGRRALIRAGGIEIGAIHAATFGAVSSEPIFKENYSEEDLQTHYGAAQAGQIIPSILEGPGASANPGYQYAPAGGGGVSGTTVYNQVEEIKQLLAIARLYAVTSNSNSSTSPSSGETNWTSQGREAHKVYNPGSNYTVDRKINKLKNDKIPDAIDIVNKIVRELKPNNPRAIAKGWDQVKKYARQLQKQSPPGTTWRIAVDTYEPDGAGGFNYKYGTLQELP
jgi:RHS repeat-associated protein